MKSSTGGNRLAILATVVLLSALGATPILARTPMPIDQLPASVKPDAGKVTLYADFQNTAAGSTTVYIINRTGEAVTVETPPWGVYLLLECQDDAGQWVRAQAVPFQLRMCGLYPPSPILAPRTFIKDTMSFDGTAGEKRKVRYALYQKGLRIVSNTGEMLVNQKSVRRAANDLVSVTFADTDRLIRIATGELVLDSFLDGQDRRRLAIECLGSGEHDAIRARQVLIGLAAGDNAYSKVAREALEELDRTGREPRR